MEDLISPTSSIRFEYDVREEKIRCHEPKSVHNEVAYLITIVRCLWYKWKCQEGGPGVSEPKGSLDVISVHKYIQQISSGRT